MSAPTSPFDDRDTISVPTCESPAAPQRNAKVVALRILESGEELELPDLAEIQVGKGTAADLLIRDHCVSRRHCVLERRAEGLFVRDRRSRNGTFLNGHRVQDAKLLPGSVLAMGKTTLVVLGEKSRGQRTAFEQLLGHSIGFRSAVLTGIKAASSDCSVLIVGETGTGKELLAQAVHEASPRASGPFVALNCGAISRELIGSELFGHRKGAFTGADVDREGVFVRADGGSLFLDELGELPREQQPHLLRVLETRTLRPVGAELEQQVDVRVIAATNRAVANSDLFRGDLYHRLATIVVQLPPLRHRRTDIPLLVHAFIEQLQPQFGPRVVTPETMRALIDHDWPGNVRQLRHAVERAMMLCPHELTRDVMLRDSELAATHRNGSATPQTDDAIPPMEGIVRDMMVEAYRLHGNVRGAAESLGMAKSTFCDRARRFGIRLKTKLPKRSAS